MTPPLLRREQPGGNPDFPIGKTRELGASLKPQRESARKELLEALGPRYLPPLTISDCWVPMKMQTLMSCCKTKENMEIDTPKKTMCCLSPS